MPTYAEKLRDPRWQKKRLEIMQRANFACEDCGTTTVTLNIHHAYYRRGYEPWEYPDDSYQCLCENCHEVATRAKEGIEELLFSLPPSELSDALLSLRRLRFNPGLGEVLLYVSSHAKEVEAGVLSSAPLHGPLPWEYLSLSGSSKRDELSDWTDVSAVLYAMDPIGNGPLDKKNKSGSMPGFHTFDKRYYDLFRSVQKSKLAPYRASSVLACAKWINVDGWFEGAIGTFIEACESDGLRFELGADGDVTYRQANHTSDAMLAVAIHRKNEIAVHLKLTRKVPPPGAAEENIYEVMKSHMEAVKSPMPVEGQEPKQKADASQKPKRGGQKK
jgi:hypothetical protein